VRTTESTAGVVEPEIRPVLAGAVELARAAAVESGEGVVGAHLGVRDEDGDSATHRFAAELAGYRGWEWSVVVAAGPDDERATVSEVVLLPGADALVSPGWLPWEERVRAGDLGPGDLLPPPADDPRLVPGYVASDDPAVEEVALEVGLGRRQVMSREGRLDAADRWFSGDGGPAAPIAVAAEQHCGTCGFYLPLGGSLRAAFGVCGNEMSADGRVVHAEHGCGAHSDTVVAELAATPISELSHDDELLDVVTTDRAGSEPTPAPALVPGEPIPAQAPEVVPSGSPEVQPDPAPEEVGPQGTPTPAAPDAPLDPTTPVEPDEPTRTE
jgi:hypothetical protein